MTIPRVLVRGSPSPTSFSVFDTVVHGVATAHNLHYDRTLISLIEPTPGVVSIDRYERSSSPVGDSSGRVLCMGRARSCPALNSTPCPTTLVDRSKDSQREHRHPFVRLAVVGLVFDAAGSLLLTRRPIYMRSFPSAWVLPGGTVNSKESLLEAVQREVWEETGIHSEVDSWKLESVWESVYPTSPLDEDMDERALVAASAIRAHHLVVYLSTTLSSVSPSLVLCDEEVEAAVWLTQDDTRTVVEQDFKTAESSRLLLQTNTNGLNEDMIPLRHLLGIYPHILSDGSRIGMAQGSLFAMEEYLGSIGSLL